MAGKSAAVTLTPTLLGSAAIAVRTSNGDPSTTPDHPTEMPITDGFLVHEVLDTGAGTVRIVGCAPAGWFVVVDGVWADYGSGDEWSVTIPLSGVSLVHVTLVDPDGLGHVLTIDLDLTG